MYVIIVHIDYIILLFGFLFKKLITIEVVLLHEFIHIWSGFRFYAWLITYVIYITETTSLTIHRGVKRSWCRCLQVWQIPEELLVVLILIFSWKIMQVSTIILEKRLILYFLNSIFDFWIGFRWIKHSHLWFDCCFFGWLRNGRGLQRTKLMILWRNEFRCIWF